VTLEQVQVSHFSISLWGVVASTWLIPSGGLYLEYPSYLAGNECDMSLRLAYRADSKSGYLQLNSFLKEYNKSIDVETIMSETLLPRFAVENVLNDLAQVGLLQEIS
jgi:hypothetical protein